MRRSGVSSSFEPRRVWLEELLALPHLWPEQVAQVRALAAELGVEVVLWRYRLNEPALGWQAVAAKEAAGD